MGPWTFMLMPELTRADGTRDYAGARLVMQLLRDKGTDWVFTAWMNGSLAGLLAANRYG
jgi:hypothetical protein